MLKPIRRSSAVLLVLLLLPAAAHAQAAITGVVKDTSGAVLPGATVEAASPVLIEKVRSVVSDGTGQYRIVGLPPGTYSVTFTLPGFSTVKREGIELTGTFVATVNGDLKVGALEETITVTGETPVVDVQSAKVQQTVSKDVLAAIPTSRTASGIQALIPGLSQTADSGASGATGGSAGAIHGGRANDSRMLNDGLSTAYNNTGGGGGNNANVAGAQEVVISTSGGLGEAETAGVVINLIPREGGNTFSGTMFYSGANGSMQGSNYTQALQNRGLQSPQKIVSVYDINPMGGGRIIRDRLWFFNTFRVWGAKNTVPGIYWNNNAGNPNAWTVDFDKSRPAVTDALNGTGIGRLTWQATSRNKISAYWSEQWNCNNCIGGGNATTTIEATGRTFFHPSHIQQVTYASPVTSKVLVEAGWGTYQGRYRNHQPRTDGTYNPLMIRVVDQAGIIPGLAYRADQRFDHNLIGTMSWRASVSYITGAHGMKFGYYGGFFNPSFQYHNDNLILDYRFKDGVPNQLNEVASFAVRTDRNVVPTSFYAQDQWTTGQLTLQGGVRYDHLITSFPEQHYGGTSLAPLISFPSRSLPGLKFNDVTPRMGVAYDLFGNGKTAVKVNLGKYVTAISGKGTGELELDPLTRLSGNVGGIGFDATTRSWTDSNKNFVPDCNLANPAKNLECGAMANQNFGTSNFSNFYDPAITTGWGTRGYNWEFGASVQQELAPRVSGSVGYFRRWFGNFNLNDNRAVEQSDFSPFSVPLASDPRLPDGGGYTVTDLFDLNPAKFGLLNNNRVAASNYGKQIEHWNGVDVGITARLRNGLTVQGGTSTGRTLTDNCDVLPKVDNPSKRFCRVVTPYQTQLRGLATYTIPRVDLQVSGTWSSNPGPQLAANYNVPTALVKPTLGRDLSGGANTLVNLVAPGTLFGDRINNLDFRVAKIFKFRQTRTQVGVDIYNATNTAAPTAYNQTYVPGGAWLTPTAVLPARWAKIGAQFDF